MVGSSLVLGVLAAGLIHPAAAGAAPCPPGEVVIQPDGFHGVVVFVNVPGPDNIVVDLVDGVSLHHRLFQQIPPKMSGATFNFRGLDSGAVAAAVTSKTLGSCYTGSVEPF